MSFTVKYMKLKRYAKKHKLRKVYDKHERYSLACSREALIASRRQYYHFTIKLTSNLCLYKIQNNPGVINSLQSHVWKRRVEDECIATILLWLVIFVESSCIKRVSVVTISLNFQRRQAVYWDCVTSWDVTAIPKASAYHHVHMECLSITKLSAMTLRRPYVVEGCI